MPETTNPQPKKIDPSKLMGSTSPALGQVGSGGESKVGKLARVVRTTRVKVNDNTKEIKINTDKLMGVEDEQEQIHETIFGLVEKQGETKAILAEQKDKISGDAIENLAANLDTIAKELASINSLLGNQLKTQEANAKKAQQAAVREKRAKEEKERESKGKTTKRKGAEFKAPKPVVDFFEKIKNFFTQVLLGSAVVGILKWLKDPQNKKKINDVIDFVADNVPIILGGLLAIVGLGIGAKLIAFMTGLVGITTTLIGLMGPAGLMAVLIAATGALATLGIIKAREAFSNWRGGVGFTETGLAFGYQDIEDITQRKLDEMDKKISSGEMTIEEAREAKKPYDDLMAAMRTRKNTNDSLAQTNKNIKFLQDKIEKAREAGNDRDVKRNEDQLKNVMAQQKKLQVELQEANRQVTQAFAATGITEREITQSLEGRGAMVTRMPGSVAPDLRQTVTESSGEQYGSAAASATDLGAGAFQPTNKGIQSFNSTMSGITNSMMPDRLGMQEKDFGSTMRMNQAGVDDAFGMDGMMKSPFKGLGNQAPPIKLDTQAMRGKMIIDIPPPEKTDVITALPGIGPMATPGGGAAVVGNQNRAPSFSPYDPNNDTLAPVMSVYNATQ
jgi:hypothetical protein